MGSVGSLVFTGLSSYSSDFQSILDRGNQIAQLPITKLQNEQSDNLSKKQALIGLNPTVDSLGSAITALGTVASTQGLTANSSDWTTVSVANTGATTPATYTISNIQSLASAAWATSTGFADTDTTPVSTAGQNLVDLTVGSNVYHLDLTDNNNLQGLADAINNAGAGVTAQILTTDGSNYLSISAQNAGETTLELSDVPAVGAPVSLLGTSYAGSNADFMLNGTIHVVRSSNTVNDIIPGVSFTLKNTTAGSVTLSLASDTSQLSGALQTFVNSYNALFDSVAQQTGASSGVLGGDMLMNTIRTDMQQVASYWNTGTSIHSLADLGVTFDDTSGHLTFSQSTFASLSDTQISDAYKFVGSSQSGLAALAGNFTQLSDPVSGMIRIQEDGYDSSNNQLTDQINNLETRATAAQSALQAQIQAADALCAQLESQQNNVGASLTSLNYVLYGRQTNVNGL
jgi:flagellar hook-associated protein 2